ncbi:MAG: DNA cytosine methyltransferase [Desulfurococcaceae archaeon]|jgi:DNA (cytosine-5)-methyltransferase 1|nr:DNA cytosine methyltransferase [Desulfurococcaceae archaeon]
MSKYKFIDLFSGAGGFSLGFYLTGKFQPILAIDNFKPAAETYKANFPEVLVLVEDIRDLREDDLLKIAKPGEIDLVIGSPPCEPFTGANPSRQRNPLDRLYTDQQGQLVLHFIRIVGYYKPRVFIMENVPAIAESQLREALVYEFKRIGYKHVYFNLLNAEHYGTPSRRRRVFISNIPIKPPRVEKPVTVSEALSDLPPPTTIIPNHDPPPELPYRKLRRVACKRWGEALIYFHGAKKLIPNLIRLNPSDLAPTVMGSSRFIHPFENRLLTVREQARLMGFPDTFIFTGGRDSQYNMIGEAVPVPLARAIALYTYRVLESGDV